MSSAKLARQRKTGANETPALREPTASVAGGAAHDVASAQDLVLRVRRHLKPAFDLLAGYLELVCQHTGAGGSGVLLSRGAMREDLGGASLEEYVWAEFPGMEHELVLSVSHARRFCTLMRQNPHGMERCRTCDLAALRRIVRTRKPHVYECHAGLVDCMAPVVVHDTYVGVVCIGQFLSPRTQRFEHVWAHVSDIPDLGKEQMQAAFEDMTVLSKERRPSLAAYAAEAAHIIAELWETMVALASQEKLLSRVHLYQEREFAELLLGGAPFSREEARARAQALGIESLPTMAIVLQVNPVARLDASRRLGEGFALLARLTEVIQRHAQRVQNALVTSMAPDEVVVLMHWPEAANAHLTALRGKEFARVLREDIRRTLGLDLLVGLGSDYGKPELLSESYREARQALWLDGYPDAGEGAEPQHLVRTLTLLEESLGALADSVRTHRASEMEAAFERVLRVIASVPEEDTERRLSLYTRMVERFLLEVREEGIASITLEEIQMAYLRSYPSLRTLNDIAKWTNRYLAPVAEQVDASTGIPVEQSILIHACELAQASLEPRRRASIASQLNVSESYLGKLFRKHLGLPFRQYQQMVRVARAQEYLLDPLRSISDVAFEVGYSEVSAFTRAFTRLCGVSPSDYRASPRSYPRILPPSPGKPRSSASTAIPANPVAR